jgi:hypothetical protein
MATLEHTHQPALDVQGEHPGQKTERKDKCEFEARFSSGKPSQNKHDGKGDKNAIA